MTTFKLFKAETIYILFLNKNSTLINFNRKGTKLPLKKTDILEKHMNVNS